MSPSPVIKTTCCIAGGGPAGMMLGYLLARAGVQTIVLEKHADFLRDFRGDTVHPSTLRIMDELGLLDDFLQRPHQKLDHIDGTFGDTQITIADFRRLKLKAPFLAFMPQWEFLDFLTQKGRAFPELKVMMRAEVTDLVREHDRIAGVKATTPDGEIEIHANLTVGADGRSSIVRAKAGLIVENIGAPIDVLWFRVSRNADTFDQTLGRFQPGKLVVTLDRGDYWQCAFVIPKGAIDAVKARGIESFRREVADAAPVLAAHIDDIKSWDDVKLLTVTVDRLKRWATPGLLCIGDAAHAMSPVGGVGINLAVQDAVATANLLAAKLADGQVTQHDLDTVQARRLFPAKVIQTLQVFIQNRLLVPILDGRNRPVRVPFVLKLLNSVPWLQAIPARVVGLGVRPEHVQSPVARGRS